MRPNRPADLWERLDKSGVDGCWEYQGARDKDGYGFMKVREYQHRTHRLAWELTHGPITDGLHVLHRCDNPPCCNPEHLWLGTEADNAADRDRKGRTNYPRGDAHYTRRRPDWVKRGEQVPGAKLTWAAVREMRELYAAGWGSHRELSLRYGVSRELVREVVNSRRWKETA